MLASHLQSIKSILNLVRRLGGFSFYTADGETATSRLRFPRKTQRWRTARNSAAVPRRLSQRLWDAELALDHGDAERHAPQLGHPARRLARRPWGDVVVDDARGVLRTDVAARKLGDDRRAVVEADGDPPAHH